MSDLKRRETQLLLRCRNFGHLSSSNEHKNQIGKSFVTCSQLFLHLTQVSVSYVSRDILIFNFSSRVIFKPKAPLAIQHQPADDASYGETSSSSEDDEDGGDDDGDEDDSEDDDDRENEEEEEVGDVAEASQ